MGDLLSPPRRDVVDRLRRRIQLYRRHQNGVYQRFQPSINDVYEQCRQDTQLLRQKWLENKAKKAAKHSKHHPNRDSSAQSEQQRALVQKLKRKLDSSSNLEPGAASAVGEPGGGSFSYNNTTGSGSSPPPLKKKSARVGGVDLSVQIVQQISAPPEHSGQTIETNVTVSSTLKTVHNPPTSCSGSNLAPGNTDNNNSQNSTECHTSAFVVECKQEPTEEPACASDVHGATSANLAELGELDLQALLDAIEKEGGIPEDLLNELESLDSAYNSKIAHEDKDLVGDAPMNVLNQESSISHSLQQKSQYLESTQQQTSANPSLSQMYIANQNMNPLPSPTGMQHYRTGPSPGSIPGNLEGGPAAETLKQMAAQHQSQNQMSGSYGIKTAQSFPDHYQNELYAQRNGYPTYPQSYNGAPMYQYSQPNSINSHVVPPSMHAGKPDLPVNYGGTKRLSHFPVETMAGQNHAPSSLQQLQNQVRAQFNQTPQQTGGAPGMHINQNQHMQVTHNQQRLQMSQSQQVHMHPPPQQISVSQQQSFNISPNMAAAAQQNQHQFMNDPIKMQMYHKMRQQREQQFMQQQRQAAHMQQQFMGRPPPPDYKMQQQQASQQQSQTGNSSATGYIQQSPLETMQHMVNQTTSIHSLPPGYPVKTEHGAVAGGHPGQPPGIPQMSNPTNMPPNYPPQHLQQQQQQRPNNYKSPMNPQPPISNSVVGGATGVASSAHVQRTNTPTYTSALLRNQRPPNVNVGPDGLNISQQRNTAESWPSRPIIMVQGPRGHSSSSNRASPLGGGGGGGGMMSYGSYPGAAPGSESQADMQMMQAQQSTAMMQNGHPANMGAPSSIMMQQSMQMSQMNMAPGGAGAGSQSSANYSMASSVGMGTSAGPMSSQDAAVAYAGSGNTHSHAPQPHHAEFPLDFLNNAQANNPDFFENVGEPTSASDFMLLDEILGK